MKTMRTAIATVFVLTAMALPAFAIEAHGGRVHTSANPTAGPAPGVLDESGKTVLSTIEVVAMVLKTAGVSIEI